MALKRQQNWLSQQRVDVPHLRSTESAIANDFDALLRGWITRENYPYFVKGFSLIHSIGGAANGLYVVVEDAAIFHSTATKAGTLLTVPAGTPNEILSSSNSKVSGSFTINATNFLALDYTREPDSTTEDLVTFYSPDTQREFTKVVPLSRTLDYRFVINATGFGTLLPIAKIVTDINGLVLSITDCRPMLMRLGQGGTIPDPFHTYGWPDGLSVPGSGRHENPSFSATAGITNTPFEGGDKEIKSLKDWMDAVMSRILEIDGGTYWYSAGTATGSIKWLREDAINSQLTGVGRFVHGVVAGDLSWTSDLYLRLIAERLYYRIAATPVPLALTDDQVAYITLIRDVTITPALLTFNLNQVTSSAAWTAGLVLGDWIKNKVDGNEYYTQIFSVDSPTQVTLVENYPGTTGIGQIGAYTKEYYNSISVADRKDVPNDANTYWIALRDDLAFAPLTIDAAPTGAVRSTNVVTITTTTPHSLVVGQTVNITGVTDTSFNVRAEIASVPGATSFTFAQAGPDATSGSGTVTFISKIYLRWGQELEQGETIQISDPDVSPQIKAYIGMTGDVGIPSYLAIATGALALPDYGAVANEDLTARAARLTTMMADKAQDKMIRLREGGDISWSGPPANTLSWIDNFVVEMPGSPANPTIAGPDSWTLLAGEALYFTVPSGRQTGGVLALTKVAEGSVPIDENTFVLAHRGADQRVYMMDGTSLGPGDTVKLGAAGTGSGNEDFDRHQDALSENDFEEIFIDILDDIDNINPAKTTLTATGKRLVASTDAILVDYDPKGGVLPPADPNFPWTGSGAAADSIVSDKLRINDTAVDYRYYYRSAAIASNDHAEINSEIQIVSTVPDVNNFTGVFWEINDALHRMAVGIFYSAGIYTIGFLNATNTGLLASTSSFPIIPLAPQRIRLVKIGDHAVQLYVEGMMALVYPYSIFDVAAPANQMAFGTISTTAEVDARFGTTGYSVYSSIMETYDIARKPTTIMLEGDVLPELATPVWTKTGGLSAVITDDQIDMVDATGVDGIAYDLGAITLGLDTEGRRKSVSFEASVEVLSRNASQGALNAIGFVRLSDGVRDIIVAITHDGTNQGLALATDMTFATAVTGTIPVTGLDWTNHPHSIRIEKTGDTQVVIKYDRNIIYTVDWENLPVSSTAIAQFGTGIAGGFGSQCRLLWSSIYYSKPGEDWVVESPVIDFLGTLTTDDIAPILWFSSDNGKTWCDGPNGKATGLDIWHAANPGTRILFRAGLAKSGSFLYDYSVMYNQTRSTETGIHKYYEYTAVGGETLITLPWSYVQNNDEIEVIENGVELYVGAARDYTETSPASITLTTPAIVGDRYKFRVNRQVVDASVDNRLDILQLSKDLYEVPSVDHDGLANLDMGLAAFLKGYKHFPSTIYTPGSANPVYQVTIKAPAAIEINGNLRRITSDITIDITVAGDREGALTNDTWYYIYAIADTPGTTFTAKFSTTAPTMDANKGGWYHPANANWRFICTARHVGYVAASGTAEFGGSNGVTTFGGPFATVVPTVGLRPFSKGGDIVTYAYKPRLNNAFVSVVPQTESLANMVPITASASILQVQCLVDGSTTFNGSVAAHISLGIKTAVDPAVGLGGAIVNDITSRNQLQAGQDFAGTGWSVSAPHGCQEDTGIMWANGNDSVDWKFQAQVVIGAGSMQAVGSIYALGCIEPF